MAVNGRPDLPGYEDLELVGRGGYGQVFRARQPAFGRTVAIKLLFGGQDDAVTRRRFRRECRALGAVSSHPHIVAVHDAGETPDGEPYLVMDFVPGGSLADLLARSGPLPPPEVTAIGVKLAGALHTAHLAGVLHRDVKPENVLLSDYGEPQLADFGIAQSATPGTATVTATAAAMTPSHTPPERFAGGPASVVTDVYAVASTLFTVLAGRSPFQGSAEESIYAVISRAMADPAPDLRPLGVPDALARVVERALSKDPAERPQSALELGEQLQGVQSALGLPVTPLPVPRAQGVTAPRESVPGDRAPGEATPAASDERTAPVDPGAGARTVPRRSRRPGRWAAGGVAVVLVIATGVAAGLLRSSGHPEPAPGATGSGPSPAAPVSGGPSTGAAGTADADLAGSLLQPGSPSGVAAVNWTSLDAGTAARLAAVVPVACFDLYRHISPSVRGSLRLDAAPSTTALVQVIYRGAPDSTTKAMTDLRAETSCRDADRTITRVTPTGTPGLTTATADLGADAVALRVESPRETFYELFLHRGEIVCAIIWTGPYSAERNWSIALAAARAAAGRLPRF